MLGDGIALLEFVILHPSFCKEWDARVCILPKGKEILVGSTALCKCIRIFVGPTVVTRRPRYGNPRRNQESGFHCVSTAYAEMRQRAEKIVINQSRVIQNLLKLNSCLIG